MPHRLKNNKIHSDDVTVLEVKSIKNFYRKIKERKGKKIKKTSISTIWTQSFVNSNIRLHNFDKEQFNFPFEEKAIPFSRARQPEEITFEMEYV